MFSNSTIVIPWDFSEMSQAALEFAIKRTLPANIRVVCVLEKPDAFRIGIVSGKSEEEHARTDCESEFWEKVDREVTPELSFDAVFGDPATVASTRRVDKARMVWVIVSRTIVTVHGFVDGLRFKLDPKSRNLQRSCIGPTISLES